jgi:hypothetical protein
MERVVVSHKHKNLLHGRRLPIRPVIAHVQPNDDGLQAFPPRLVRDVEKLGIMRTREQIVDVHDAPLVWG